LKRIVWLFIVKKSFINSNGLLKLHMSCNFCLFFNFFVPKTYVFESFRWGTIPLDFMSFSLRIFKSKNDISYIEYEFWHRFGKVCRWLNMYYSNIRIIIILKITTMSIWIIIKNLAWTYRECIFLSFLNHCIMHLPSIKYKKRN